MIDEVSALLGEISGMFLIIVQDIPRRVTDTVLARPFGMATEILGLPLAALEQSAEAIARTVEHMKMVKATRNSQDDPKMIWTWTSMTWTKMMWRK